jgi:hypothetical protein
MSIQLHCTLVLFAFLAELVSWLDQFLGVSVLIKRSPLVALCAIALAGLAGCQTAPIRLVDQDRAELPATGNSPSGSTADSAIFAANGIRYLAKGDETLALKLFSAAIKLSPERSDFHFLSGLTYHLKFLKGGNYDMRDSAEVGYRLAARFSPGDPEPWIQLGRLHLDANLPDVAVDDFAVAIEKQPRNADALQGLITAAYLVGDLKLALWGVRELEDNRGDPKVVNRMKSVFFTLAGQREQAATARQAYGAALARGSADASAEGATFDKRLLQIQALVEGQQWLRKPDVASTRLMETQTQDTRGSDVTLSQTPAVETPPPEAPGPNGPRSAGAGERVKPWTECLSAPAAAAAGSAFGFSAGPTGGFGGGGLGGGFGGGGFGGGGFGGGGSGTQGEETAQLNAVPAPCVGDPQPKMAVIDVVMLRTEDEISRGYGINLLQGLTGFFSRNATTTRSSGGQGNTTTIDFRGFGGASSLGSGAGALAYSLNIANATNNRNEVLARPSLLAIDRMPSTFFSGTTVSIPVSGGAGSFGQLVDKPIGVSMSITPTILDDENLLLAVKVVRSFVEIPLVGIVGAAVSASRNSVTANVSAKFGQTIVISGLTERELLRGDSGVPVLKDIPGVQYLFDKYTSVDFFRTVMVMITPRKPVADSTDIREVYKEQAEKRSGQSTTKKYAFHWRIEEFDKALARSAPNLDQVLETLSTNRLYLGLKDKDLIDTNWAAKSKLERMLHDLAQTILH